MSPIEKEKRRRSISSPIVLCKRTADVKRLEKKEDCFILNFDPCKPIEISDDEPDDGAEDDKAEEEEEEIAIVGEKGEIASRHYPHARHLCPQFPFATTQHDKHCKKCHCYVCDLAAPCDQWTHHCDATDQGIRGGLWKSERDIARTTRSIKKVISEGGARLQEHGT